MTAEQENGKPVDPFEALRGVRDIYLESMSKAMIDAVNSEEYAQATGSMLDGYLTMSAPLREALDKTMVQTQEKLSLPSREQIASLAERFTNLEMRIDDIDAKLSGIVKLLAADRPADARVAPEAWPAATAEAASQKKSSARKGQGSL